MCLIRNTEFRLLNLDESVTAEEIKEIVAARGKMQLSDIRVGPLRPARDGLNTAWLQCPVTCAELLQRDGSLRVGWSRVRMIPLVRKRLQCYKYFAVGHTRMLWTRALQERCGQERWML